MSWSGGKDSALALYDVLKGGTCRVAALLTTVTEDYDRISMHGVRRSLLEQQAAALGISLEKVLIPRDASNEEYEANMAKALAKYSDVGVQSGVFGDIFLEDLRKYREEKLASAGMKAVFSLQGAQVQGSPRQHYCIRLLAKVRALLMSVASGWPLRSLKINGVQSPGQ